MGASEEGPLYAARVKLEVERRLFGGDGVLRVGRFEVGEPIGAGGMSVVYRARDPALDRVVALKLLRDDVAGERLFREARALARLRHPNVVTVYEVGRWREHVFLALEHVEGATLSAWCAAPRSLAEVVRVMRGVADGLAAVHDLGLVHRDVKPENVVVDDEGAPRLVDFGLVTGGPGDTLDGEAATAPVSGTLTRPGATPGTPRFIAPERLSGSPASAASDQFSFGVTLETALAGQPDADAVRRVAERARSAAPGDRYEDMRALGAALALAAPSPRARQSFGERASVGAALGAAVLFAVVTVGFFGREPPAAAPADDDPLGYAPLVEGTEDEEARATLLAGLTSLRDGDRNDAALAFERAAERDPTYGAAYLWRALLASHGNVNQARTFFAPAFAARASMGAPLRVILDALVPCIQAEPIDELVCETGLEEAARRARTSPHLWYEAARHRMARVGITPEVVDRFERALDADPGFLLALYAQAQALAYLGRFDEALAATDACLRVAPGSDACVHDRMWIFDAVGDCEAMARDARRMRAAAPANSFGYGYLASAAIASGEPLEVVRELLSQAASRMAAPSRPFFEARDELLLAVLAGRFDQTPPLIEVMEATLATEADRASRLLGRRMSILVALETGEREAAARIAAEALVAQDAWMADPRNEDFGIARDATPFLLDVLRETGALTDAERATRRDAWLADWRSRAAPAWEPYLWLAGYARQVDDELEAREAIAAMPATGPPPFHPLTFGEPGIGRTHLFAGDAAAAVPYLEHAARSCQAVEFAFGLENGWESIRASRDLGLALERTGDREAACAAYAHVLSRWGAASPRSVTADDARTRMAALGCVAP